MFCFGTEIGTENRGFSLVLVPNTEILVPWQPYDKVSVFINAIKVFVNTAYSTSQLNECNVAKMNGLLQVE